MNSEIHKAGRIADDIYKIGGVVVLLVTAIFSCGMAWYQIWENEQNILNLRHEIEEELELRDMRSDKRYKRAMEIGYDHEDRIRKNETDITYIKGKEGY